MSKLIRLVIVAAATTAAAGCAGDGTAVGHPAGPASAAAGRRDDAVATPVLVRRLDAPVGREVRIATIEYAPGGGTPPHRHPGAIFAYVLAGEVVMRLDDGKDVRYRAGGAWYERPGQLHAVSRNASATVPAKLLVYFVTEPGEPQLHFEED